MKNFKVLEKLVRMAGYDLNDAIILYGLMSLIEGGITEEEIDNIFPKK